jgi:branched-chain amino acid transport system permease protein
MSAYYALVAIGLSTLMGYAGQVSLGQAGFFAIGGYTTAVLTTTDLSASLDEPFFRILDSIGLILRRTSFTGEESAYLSPWIAFAVAIAITVVVATAFGRPILALRGHYLAMATLGFGIIIYRIVLGTRVFGEADGISNVPPFDILPGLTVSGALSDRIINYYIAWLVVVLGLVALIHLVNSRIGRSLRALHSSEEAAAAMGVDTAKSKLSVFVIGAVFAAIAGILTTQYTGGIGPSEAGVTKSVRYVAIVAIGGMANLWGTLIMAVVLNFLSLRGVFGSYDDAVFGGVLIVMMMVAPKGFLQASFVRELKVSVGRFFGRRSKLAAYLTWHRRGFPVKNPLSADAPEEE